MHRLFLILFLAWYLLLLVTYCSASTITQTTEEDDDEPKELQWSDCWEKYLPGQSTELKQRVAFECSGFSAPLYRNMPDPLLWLYKTQLKTIRVRLHRKDTTTPNVAKRVNVWVIPGGPGQGLQSVELSNGVRYLDLFPEAERWDVTVYIPQIRFFEYNLAVIKDLKILREVVTLNHGYPLEWISTDIVAQDFLDVVYAVQRQEPCVHRHYIHGISYGALVALQALRRAPEGTFAGMLSDTGATPDFHLNELGVNMTSIVEESLKLCSTAGSRCPTDLKTLINGMKRPNAQVKAVFMERICKGKEYQQCLQEVSDYAIHMTQVDTKIGEEWEQTSLPFLLFALLTLLARGGSPELTKEIIDTIDLLIIQGAKQDRLTRNLGKPLAPKDSELDESIYLRPNIMVYTKIILSEMWIDPIQEAPRISAFLDAAHPLSKLLFSRERAEEADSVLNFIFDHWTQSFPWFQSHRKIVAQLRENPLPLLRTTKFLFISAGMDAQVPAFQIRNFAEKMRQIGNPLVTYLHFAQARHMPVVTWFKEEGIQMLLRDFFSEDGSIGPELKYPLPGISWNLVTPLFATPDNVFHPPMFKAIPPRKSFGEYGPKVSQELAPLEPEQLPMQIKIAFGCLIATTLVTFFVFVYWLSIQFRLISLMRHKKSCVQMALA